MHSELLLKHGLINRVAGSDYNFRYQTVGNNVTEDVNRLLNEMNVSPDAIYSGQQGHTAHIAYVDGKNGEDFAYGKTFKDTDGLITDKKNVALLIKYADCTPIVLFDPVQKVLASVHSGWRGTVEKIGKRAVDRMVEEFHCKKEDILAYVGPSIDQANYEVGKDVYDAFASFDNRNYFFEPKGEKFLLSMTDANLSVLLEAGLLEDHIEIERVSTYTDDRLHSARQEGPTYGLNGILTMMTDAVKPFKALIDE